MRQLEVCTNETFFVDYFMTNYQSSLRWIQAERTVCQGFKMKDPLYRL